MSVGLFSGCLISIALAESLPLALRLPLSMLSGGMVAAVFGLIIGLPALRLKGDYLAIVTLACGEIIKNLITNLKFTGGALGLNTGAIYSNTKALPVSYTHLDVYKRQGYTPSGPFSSVHSKPKPPSGGRLLAPTRESMRDSSN